MSEEGKRSADAPVVDEQTLRAARARDDVVVVLGHAGPDAGRWRAARAVGPADVPAATSARRARPLDDAGWDDVVRSFAAAAALVRQVSEAAEAPAQGPPFVLVDASDDGLLACTLSPLSFPGASSAERRAKLVRVLEAVHAGGVEVGVLLTVEDLAPGGIDPTAGIEIARACTAAGASLVVARAGTAWFTDLRSRPRHMGEDEPWLASALWLVGKVSVPVFAAGPVRDERRALAIARGAGLAGVIAWEVEGQA